MLRRTEGPTTLLGARDARPRLHVKGPEKLAPTPPKGHIARKGAAIDDDCEVAVMVFVAPLLSPRGELAIKVLFISSIALP